MYPVRIATLLFMLVACSFSAHADILELNTAALSGSRSASPPDSGWAITSLPLRGSNGTIAWLRFTFDTTAAGDPPLAISIDSASERFDAFLNGKPLYRNYVVATGQNFASAQPYLIAVPDALLQHGSNTLDIRLETAIDGATTLDGVQIGPGSEIKRHYDWRYITQFLGPQLVNAILIAMTFFAAAFWLARRRDTSLAWLAATGLFWSMTNLQYFMTRSAIDPALTHKILNSAQFLLAFVIIGFAATYFKLQNRNLIIATAAILTALAIAGHLFLQASGRSANLMAVPVAILIAGFFVHCTWKAPALENLATLAATLVALFAAFHDTGALHGLWHGAGFALMPYASIVVFSTFALAIGKTFIKTLSATETRSELLGRHVETTKADLMASQAARRSLEISSAVTRERERMMREIHDGIGSSLVAALASAERRGKENTTAIVALKSALTDLRIAVDSLEPVEGDVATLLASLRYRLEPELKKAGIAFDWKVDEVPELAWLDAPNALHVLRIFQEALGNILGHANATRITVACAMAMNEGRAGVTIRVSDDGAGFDPAIPPQGRGRKNMMGRAEALGGKLVIESALGRGSSTLLWLPLARPKV